ncbi:MAG: hypothetical protein QOJ86_5050 [Bradyrhizobium sp.]|nr:hypothetical protein [Bradyrhizobium sp.]
MVITGAQKRGQVFEDYVGEVLQAFSRRNGLKFDQFGSTFQPDGGKDFALVTPSGLEGAPKLFGVRLQASTRYLIEAKYVEPKAGTPQKLGFNRFISNLSQAKLERSACVFLVTSTQINPQALCTASEIVGKDFLVPVPGLWVDQLAQNLGISRPAEIDVGPLRGIEVGKGITADIWHSTRRASAGDLRYYFIALYNQGDRPKSVDIVGQSAEDWSFVPSSVVGDASAPNIAAFEGAEQSYERTETIDPGRVLSLSLVGRMKRGRLSRESPTAKTEVRILARCEDGVAELARQRVTFDPVYLPRFVGTAHKKAAASIAHTINRTLGGIQTILVTGEAGVGKSRTVDEALASADGIQLDIFPFTLEGTPTDGRKVGRVSNRDAFEDFAKTVTRATFGQDASRNPLRECANIIDVIGRVRAFRRGKSAQNLKLPVFIIEDLHHVSGYIARELVALATESPDPNEPPCVLILTGRDDNTFENRYCWSLYADLKQLGTERNDTSVVHVEPLTHRTARTLISSIVEGIQESSIDRILRLSGSIPNNIVQCVEYLLDQSLIEVAKNATLSIVDQLTFERRSQTLPRSMAELLVTRFSLLGEDELGEQAKHALIAATLFGTYIPKDALELDFTGTGRTLGRVIEHLLRRRFIHRSHGDFFEWSHESILMHFDTAVRSFYFESNLVSKYVEPAALAVVSTENVFQALQPLERGRTAALAGRTELAAHWWADMFTALRSASSLASATLQSSYYEQADAAIAMVAGRDPVDEELLVTLISMKAYVGGVYRSLVFCENAYRTGRQWLHRLRLSDAKKALARQRLQLILTHVLMDSGFPGVALRNALELEAHLPFEPQIKDDMSFVFDVHNTLRLIYTYSNFFALAEAHGRRAAEAARQSADLELTAMDLGDRALMYFYTDWELCHRLNRESLAIRQVLPARRGSWHSEVSTIAIELAVRQADSEWLAKSSDAVEIIINECRYNRYHPVLPRIYLLQATLFHLLECDSVVSERSSAADTMIGLGLDACERFSIGYVSWQLHNLRAVRAARSDEWRLATRTIRTAAAMIHKEGLTFLGDGPLVSAVPVVLANFIKIMKRTSTDREIAGMLGRIHGFSNYDLERRDARLRCEEQAKQSAAILCDDLEEPPFSLLIDRKTNLAITVWF